MLFEKKDWLWFFKLSLFTSLILLIKGFVQFFSGVLRPGSLIGNPTFLAGYLLFSIFCSLIILGEIKNKFWKYFSIGILILSICGIFITGTRGTIVGLGMGIVSILVYGIFVGKNSFYKKLNLQKVSIVFLCLIFVFSTVFIFTMTNPVWSKVPGFSRIVVIGKDDPTTSTRLIIGKLSLEAVNPMQNGIKKLLIGWGPEGFSLAYAKYFNPIQYKYEIGWFTRAHNKIFDLLVVNGVFGLLMYLALYFLLLKAVLKKKTISLLNTGLLFFSVALFFHLLFVFDQITTSIPFFALLAFVLYLLVFEHLEKEKKDNPWKFKQNQIKIGKTGNTLAGILFSTLTLFLCFVFFKNDLPAYIQMKEYASLRAKSDPQIMTQKIEKVFSPFTTAQTDIRNDFLSLISKNYDSKNESIVKLSNLAFLKAEEYMEKVPLDVRFLAHLSEAYSAVGNNLNDLAIIKKGESDIEKALIFAPARPDFNFDLALDLYSEKRYEESFNNFENIFKINPTYFSQKGKEIEGIYTLFIQYFYQTKNKDLFIKTAERLKENNYANSSQLDEIIDFVEKNNVWPFVNFKKE